MKRQNFSNETDTSQKPTTRTAFYLRLSQKEYTRVLNMVAATRISAQELFRRALLDRMDLENPIYLMAPEQANEFGNELKRQGNNINQIAYKLNSGLMTGWSQALAGINAGYVKLNHMLAVNSANR